MKRGLKKRKGAGIKLNCGEEGRGEERGLEQSLPTISFSQTLGLLGSVGLGTLTLTTVVPEPTDHLNLESDFWSLRTRTQFPMSSQTKPLKMSTTEIVYHAPKQNHHPRYQEDEDFVKANNFFLGKQKSQPSGSSSEKVVCLVFKVK